MTNGDAFNAKVHEASKQVNSHDGVRARQNFRKIQGKINRRGRLK